MLIKGEHLTRAQRDEVKRAFIYRWNKDNPMRQVVYSRIDKPKIPLQSDEQWIKEHAFHFVKDGSRLMFNRRFCVPAYMA